MSFAKIGKFLREAQPEEVVLDDDEPGVLKLLESDVLDAGGVKRIGKKSKGFEGGFEVTVRVSSSRSEFLFFWSI